MFRGYRPLALPQAFYTLVFVVAVGGVGISCWINGVSVHVIRGGVFEVCSEAKTKFFTLAMNFACVFMFLSGHHFLQYVRMRKGISFMLGLAVVLLVVSVGGFLGVVGFPEMENQWFRGMFLYGASFAFFICDFELTRVGKRVPIFFFIYDVLLIVLTIFVMFTTNTDILAFILALLRYPILGLEVTTLRTVNRNRKN